MEHRASLSAAERDSERIKVRRKKLISYSQDGLVLWRNVMGLTIEPVLQFGGAKIGFDPHDKFMVRRPDSPFDQLVVIRNDGLVFGAEIFHGAAIDSLRPVFQFNGAKIGFNPEDKFMVSLGFSPLVVIRKDGLVFGASVVGTLRGPHIQPVFQFSGAKIGFNPEDRFMVAHGNQLIVIREDGLVFGALVV
jgi:hypothetical protein